MLRRKGIEKLDGSVRPRAYMNGILKKYDDPVPAMAVGKPMLRAQDDFRQGLSRVVSVLMMVLAGLAAVIGRAARAVAGAAVRLWCLLPLEKIGLKRPEIKLKRAVRRQRNPIRSLREPMTRLKVSGGDEITVPEVYRTDRAKPGIAGRIRGLNRDMKIRMGLIAVAAVVVISGVTALSVKIGRARYDATHHDIRMELGDNEPLDLVATQETVADVLAAYDVHVGAQDQVVPPPETPLSDGMVISISRGIEVDIYTADKTHRVYMTEGTVAQALAIAGVAYDEDDVIQPALDTPIEDGMEINMIEVKSQVISQTIYLEYNTIYKNDSSLYKGETKVERAGEKGVQEQDVCITYMDDREVSRQKVRDEIVKEPVSEVVLQGTKNKPAAATPKPTTKTTAKATAKAAAKATATPGVAQTVADDKLGPTSDNPADYVIPAAPTEYVEVLQMEITAYTHTGHTTSTGKWPRDTRTRENPGSIAVVPSSIPYGTLLYVTGYGYGIAEDCGITNPMQLDCFMGTLQECLNWGRRRNVTVYIVQKP